MTDNDNMRVLALCSDPITRELLADVLSEHHLDFVSDADRLLDTAYMKGLLSHDSYDVLLATNLGIPASILMEHLRMVPDIRTYKALVISGYITAELENLCQAKGALLLRAPFKMAELLGAVNQMRGTGPHITAPRTGH